MNLGEIELDFEQDSTVNKLFEEYSHKNIIVEYKCVNCKTK